MNFARILARLLTFGAVLLSAVPAFAAEDEAFTHALTLVQMFVRAAAQSDDPRTSLKALDDVLAGRNTEANRAFAGLLEEATSDMSSEHRDKVACYGNGWFSGAKTAEDFARKATEAVSMGFRGLKWDPFGAAYLEMDRPSRNRTI